MIIARTAKHLVSVLEPLRVRGGSKTRVSLVNTRGGFHDGHGAVMNAARTVSDIVVVAVAPEPDIDHGNIITVSEFQDISFLEKHEVDFLYAPETEQFFPLGFEFTYSINQPHVGGDFNVGNYRLTQHLKLINAVQPDVMVWGEKNFIEYQSVRQMISDLDIRTDVQCVPTVRHADGVAVSTAVEAMTSNQRQRVKILNETLQNVAHAIRTGARNFNKIERTARLALRGAKLDVVYFSILDEDHLAAASGKTTTYRIVGSVKLGDSTVTDSLGLTL